MPVARFEMPDGRIARFEVPEGTTPEQAQQMMASYAQQNTPVAVKAGQELAGIPRQLGLTARYGLEGLGNAAEVVSEPLRYLTDRITGSTGKTLPAGALASRFADTLGLPKPQGANERVIGEASRLVAGSGGMAGAARAASNLPGLAGQAAGFLAANPTQQIASAAGAGLAGGSVKEAGAGPIEQGVAALVGGVAGGLVPRAAGAVGDAAKRMIPMKPQDVDLQISAVLNRAGVDYSAMPEAVRQSLRAELADALRTGQELNPQAVARLADFRAAGLTPTRGTVSLDPVQLTREKNLAKMAANMAEGELSGLPRLENQNNARLIEGLNSVGAASGRLPVDAGRALTGSIEGTRQGLRGNEQALWDAAKNSPGYRMPIYPDGLNAINRELGDTGMMAFMAKPITSYMEVFQTGQQPFTPQAYRNLQSMLAGEMAKGGNEAAAAGIARRALESVPMRPIVNPNGIDLGQAPVTQGLASMMRTVDAQPAASIDAVNRARAATRAAYDYEDSSRVVRAALSRDADPKRIADRFIINGTPDEARIVAGQVNDQGRAVIRDALATQIKKAALSGASDEVGKVSQSSLNREINKIGVEKLRLFFAPEEIDSLQRLGRVASYVQAQPAGSAVNNSNSGALLLGRGADALKGLVGKIPFGQAAVLDPIRNIEISMRNRAAQNVMPGLLAPQQTQPMGQALLLPNLAYGGLLAGP